MYSTTPRRDVTIVFAGDSGEGMQLTGSYFAHTSALAGNDLGDGNFGTRLLAHE
jgi:2-oxoglutarate ferredoxin oxidoreductase subunit alpha